MNWSRAWSAAISWFGYTFLFGILGVAIIFIGISTAGINLQNLTSPNMRENSEVILGLIEILVGLVVAVLGAVASFFKVNSEITGEEVSDYLA